MNKKKATEKCDVTRTNKGVCLKRKRASRSNQKTDEIKLNTLCHLQETSVIESFRYMAVFLFF